MRVAVVGGTGLVGKLVAEELRAGGHDPVIVARSRGADLTTGAGLPEKLSGAEVVIDVSNIVTTRKKNSVAFFSQAARNLLVAAQQAGVGHLIALSIVGNDRVNLGYYHGKRAQEALIRSGPVPWTILRATQFFEFPEPLLANRSPIVVMPNMLCQPVAAAEVAATLVGHAARPPAGDAPELAGPQRLRMVDMARRLIRVRGQHRMVIPLPLPGKAGRDMANGRLLPDGGHIEGTQTFDDYLGTSADRR